MPTATIDGESLFFKSFSDGGDERFSVDVEKRTIRHTITKETVDTDGEVLLVGGLDFTRLNKTKTVFWNHNRRDVIGKNIWLNPEENKVVALTKFASTPFADEWFDLCKDGFVRAWSIGMNPQSIKYCSSSQRKALVDKNPSWKSAERIVESAEVIEYSLAPVPANSDALTEQLKAGKFRYTKAFLEEMLDKDSYKAQDMPVIRIEPKIKLVPVTRKMIEREVTKAVRIKLGLD